MMENKISGMIPNRPSASQKVSCVPKIRRASTTTPQTKNHTVANCTPSRAASSHCRSRANDWSAALCEVFIAP